MNKRTFLLQEAKLWKEEGLITDTQLNQITARYPEQNRGSALPIFAAILFGLGVLTFIASNWDGINHVARLIIIFISMIAAYGSGELLRVRGFEKIGMACTFIGVMIFGAGFFLIGQMYHLSANPVTAFYLWFAGAAAVAWHYRSQFLTFTALSILLVSGIYGVVSESRDTWTMLLFYILFAGGILPMLWTFRTQWLAALSTLTVVIVFMIDVIVRFESLLMLQGLFLLLLLIARVLPEVVSNISTVVQTISYIAMTIFSSFVIILHQEFYERITDTNTAVFIVNLLLITGLGYVLWKKKQMPYATDVVPFLPIVFNYLFVMITGAESRAFFYELDVSLILALFVFSIGMVLSGERRRDIQRINIGALLFAFSCFVSYTNFAWDFMDKSVFFLLGGALLLILSFFLERQRRKWVQEAKEEK